MPFHGVHEYPGVEPCAGVAHQGVVGETVYCGQELLQDGFLMAPAVGVELGELSVGEGGDKPDPLASQVGLDVVVDGVPGGLEGGRLDGLSVHDGSGSELELFQASPGDSGFLG